ncbi:MAG TPA: hypothetical protein VK889_07955 [Solirubrobacterales bacterium]|nr:hypothetical protein [Solirubrobacterales bacterium]
MRLAAALASALLAATVATGCGSSDDSEETSPSKAPPGAVARSCETQAVDAERLRATAVSCGEARRVMFAWQRAEGCGLIGGASRGSCVVRSYRCLSVRTGRGVSVGCARPGRSIAFLAQRG